MELKNMSPEKIREELHKRDIAPAGIARELGKSSTSVYQVINGATVSHEIRAYIAKCIEKPVEQIWPETYLVSGTPKRGRPMAKGLNVA